MLLNEFLKEHRTVETLQATVAQQRQEFEAKMTQQEQGFRDKIAQQQKQIETLAVGLQKVSDELELSKRAPQLVANGE
jgi:hypothetical protein